MLAFQAGIDRLAIRLLQFNATVLRGSAFALENVFHIGVE